MRPFLIALQFLTRIPVRLSRPPGEREERWMAGFFPLAGTLVGILAAAVYAGAVRLVTPALAVIASLTFLILLSGGLHEDGLADCADGFGSKSQLPDEVLRIMKDSRVGTFGVLALIVSFATRFVVLTSLPFREVVWSLVAAQTLGRWVVIPLALALPAARPGGLGHDFSRRLSAGPVLLASASAAAVGFFLFRLKLFTLLVLPVAVLGCFGLYCYRRIRGINGDCLGAAVEIFEIVFYISVLLLEGNTGSAGP